MHVIKLAIAEDQTIVRQGLVRLLREHVEFEIIAVARNGRELLHKIKDQHVDLVVLDEEMPEMDGLTAARKIRDRAHKIQPRIVALTANTQPGDRQKCLAAGMDDYLSKPIRVKELVAVLHKYGARVANHRMAMKSSERTGPLAFG